MKKEIIQSSILFVFLMGLTLLLMQACATSTQEPIIITPTTSVKLLFFSAPWCGECGPKLHEVSDSLHAELGPRMKQVDFTVFVVEGLRVHSHPSDAITAQYAAKSAIPDFKFVSDPWFWTTYKLYYTDSQYAVPGLALQDASGHLIKVFERGIFLPQEVTSLVTQALAN